MHHTEKILQGTPRIPRAATKTQRRQINVLKKKSMGGSSQYALPFCRCVVVFFNLKKKKEGVILVEEDRLNKSILTCQLVGGT